MKVTVYFIDSPIVFGKTPASTTPTPTPKETQK